MTTASTHLHIALFDALETLDQQLDAYGLYAIRDDQKAGDTLHPPLLRGGWLKYTPRLEMV